MIRRALLLAVVLAVLFATTALAAAPLKATFVEPFGIIEATSKVAKDNFTVCRYFAPEYADYLGRYDAPVGFTDPVELEAFCVVHFPDRIID